MSDHWIDLPQENVTVTGIIPVVGSVTVVDGSNTLLVNPDGSIDVNTTGSSTVSGTVNTNLNGLTNFQTSQYSVGITAVQLTPTPLSNRSSVSIKAILTGVNVVYIGNSSGVTTSTGYPLFNGDSVQFDLTASQTLYAISTGAAQTVCVAELG